MMHGVDYYQVLGVSRSANSAQIKASYKLLAKKFHPDLNGDAKKMMAINEAYRVLSDPHARHRYNQTLDIPKTTRRHDSSYEYVYTPHTQRQSSKPHRSQPQSRTARPRSYTQPKQTKVSKWAWAATFAVVLGILLGMGLRNPIPDTAATTLGVTTPTTAQQTQTSPTVPTPSIIRNDTPPETSPTYTDPTDPDQATPDNTNTGGANQPCSKYRKYSRSYETCMNRSTNCSSDSYYSYFDC